MSSLPTGSSVGYVKFPETMAIGTSDLIYRIGCAFRLFSGSAGPCLDSCPSMLRLPARLHRAIDHVFCRLRGAALEMPA